MRIAIDAMGGDHAPAAIVEGAVLAARELSVAVLLAGERTQIERELRRHQTRGLDVEVRHASEVIGMADPPIAALERADSSLAASMQAVREGQASAQVFAGNTGAGMMLGAQLLGCAAGVDRPAIAVGLPGGAHSTMLLDAGANVDCRPMHLAQFAVMGDAYVRALRHVAAPRVGLLSNGAEEGKGNATVRSAALLLRRMPINFVGYVEGADLFRNSVDVAVCDGFAGNLLLKALEGFAGHLDARLVDTLRRSIRTRLAASLLRRDLRELRRELDARDAGGALLLGLKATVVKAHGSSDARAVRNAVALAADLARGEVSRQVAQGILAVAGLMAEPPSHEVAEPRQAKTLWRSLRQRLRRDRPPPGQERPVHEVVAAVAQESLEAARAPGAGDSPVPEPSERAPRATPGKDEP